MRGVLSIYLLAPFPPFTYFSSYLSTLFNSFSILEYIFVFDTYLPRF